MTIPDVVFINFLLLFSLGIVSLFRTVAYLDLWKNQQVMHKILLEMIMNKMKKHRVSGNPLFFIDDGDRTLN